MTDNPHAFPQFGMAFGVDPQLLGGMTLRDYFAGQALVGLLASNDLRLEAEGIDQYVSARSYGLADAMLVERTKDAEQ
jgi:hypothetical protein